MKTCITISVEEAQEGQLRNLAKRQRRPFSWTCREVLVAGLRVLDKPTSKASDKTVAK